MDALRPWVDAHATVLLLGLLAAGLLGALLHWRGRPHWSDDVPLPMLRTRAGVILLIGGAAVFALLAAAIRAQGRLVSMDQRIAEFFATRLDAPGLRASALLSEFGDTDVLAVAGVLVALALLLTGHRLLGAAWSFTVLGGSFLIVLLKDEFQRPRPVHLHGFASETTWSFPSGHSTGAMVFYGALAYVLMVRLPARYHRALLATALLVIASIGASRVMLQVHYPSDVIAGFALGLGWLGVCIASTEFLRTSHRPRPDANPSTAAD